MKTKTNILTYAVKSDDGEKPKTNILAYAVKSDDGKKTGRSNIQADLLSK